jgi:hypothetical protein
MDQTQSKNKLKLKVSWPSPQDYNEAVQNLAHNCAHPDLQKAIVEQNAHGLPMPRSGAFASVYKVFIDGTPYAIRCFLRELHDAEYRYDRISRFVQSDDLPYTVTFDFRREGLVAGGSCVPLLKMDWVEGETLDNYLSKRKGKITSALAEKFLRMCDELRKAGIAHGDLQHGNIIIRDEEFYLVDYDGMFVPGLEGLHSAELGHRNYQHPKRNSQTFGPDLDNFSAWVIYVSLRALSANSSLYSQLGCGEDCLLFKQSDFVDPNHSPAFAAIEGCGDEQLASLARYLRYICLTKAPDAVPPLEEVPPENVSLPPIDPVVDTKRPSPNKLVVSSWMNEPEWQSGETNLKRADIGAATLAPLDANWAEPELAQPLPRKIEFANNSYYKSKTARVVKAIFKVVSAILMASAAAALALLLWPNIFWVCLWFIAVLPLGFQGQVKAVGETEEELLREGLVARAKVVRISKMPDGTYDHAYNYDPKYFLRYEYYDNAKKSRVIGEQHVTASQLSKIGNEFTVLYHPRTNDKMIYRLSKRRLRDYLGRHHKQ